MSLTLELLCQASVSLWRDSRKPEVLLTWNMSGSPGYGSRWVLFLSHIFQAQSLFKRQLTISSMVDGSHLPSDMLIFLLASFLYIGFFEFLLCQVLKLLSLWNPRSYFYMTVAFKVPFFRYLSILSVFLCIMALLSWVPSVTKGTD